MGQQLIEYFPLNTLMLINGSFPMPVMMTKKQFNAHHEKTTPTIQLKKKIRKFYHKRHFLFKKFDEGIVLDEESWYSVVPEEVASYVAERLHKRIIDQKIPIKQVIDGFCGSGGLAIQLASKFENLLCIDLDPVKLENLQANALIYQRTIETQLNNFLLIEHEFDENTILTLCPPWGGLNYQKKEVYDLEKDMTPCLSDILKKAFSISCNIVLQLPKNVSISQLTTLIQQQSQHLNFKRYSLEIEMIYINNQISQLFVYFGQIVKCNYDAEIDCILKSQTHLDRKTIKEQGLIQTLQNQFIKIMKQKIDRSRIPNSSQDILIVPVYADKLGFSLPAKLPYMPVSEDSIAETVFQANRICQKIRCEKSRIEESDPLETEKFYVTSSWVLFIVGVILFVLGFSYEDLKSTLTLLGTIFIVLPTLISIIVVIISITKSPKLIDLEQECTKKLVEFFEVQNQQYRKKGLQWSIGDEMLWIQLEKI